MNHASYKLNKSHLLTVTLLLSTTLASFSPALTAETSGSVHPNITYVDSVHQWGAWALDIKPAAGGLTQTTTGALNVRDSKFKLRTNSMAALAPPTLPQTPVLPTPPAAPAAPPPVAPPVTPPIGGPTDGLF